jgi:hypothetical protein
MARVRSSKFGRHSEIACEGFGRTRSYTGRPLNGRRLRWRKLHHIEASIHPARKILKAVAVWRLERWTDAIRCDNYRYLCISAAAGKMPVRINHLERVVVGISV